MPNHVANEVIFTGLEVSQQVALLAGLCEPVDHNPDFSILLPPPLNSWRGSVGSDHEKVFPFNDLDWCAKNWSTKWGAYGCKPIEYTADGFILRFDTAWKPPYGWLLAIFNHFKISFRYNWLSEGESRAHTGFFDYPAYIDDGGMRKCPWGESEADDDLNRHMHVLRWGDAADEIMKEASEP